MSEREGPLKAPPRGARPRWRVDEMRAAELVDAIAGHLDVDPERPNWDVILPWAKELLELTKRYTELADPEEVVRLNRNQELDGGVHVRPGEDFARNGFGFPIK